MSSIVKVEGEQIDGATYTPESGEGPWNVAFPFGSPSPELSDALMNAGVVSVEVTEIEEGTGPVGPALVGNARVITDSYSFTLVGRGSLEPVE